MSRSRKAGVNGGAPSLAEPSSAARQRRESSSHSGDERPTGPLSIVIPASEREVIKINNSNLTELKNACDDAVKRYLSRPELFQQIFTHTDVRLGLGWAGVFVAGATGLYGWKVEFEKSKPLVWTGLLLYILLTGLATLYAYFVEGDIIFTGKRKTVSKRIISERLTVSSRTQPSEKTKPPGYEVSLNYIRFTSNGKSLLGKGKTHGSKSYTEFFDESGVLQQEKLEQFVGELVEEAMEGKAL